MGPLDIKVIMPGRSPSGERRSRRDRSRDRSRKGKSEELEQLNVMAAGVQEMERRCEAL